MIVKRRFQVFLVKDENTMRDYGTVWVNWGRRRKVIAKEEFKKGMRVPATLKGHER